MDAKMIAGSAWGVPIRGSIVSLESADVSTILSAASGLAGTLAKIGAVGLGIGVAGAYLVLKSLEQRIPITAMANVETLGRRFNAIALNPTIEIDVDKQSLTIPMEFVRKIGRGSFFTSILSMELVDGSMYTGVTVKQPQLQFLSLAGVQTVDLNDMRCNILGHTTEDVRQLRNDLAFALSHNLDAVVQAVGVKEFDKYFYNGATTRQLPPPGTTT